MDRRTAWSPLTATGESHTKSTLTLNTVTGRCSLYGACLVLMDISGLLGGAKIYHAKDFCSLKIQQELEKKKSRDVKNSKNE